MYCLSAYTMKANEFNKFGSMVCEVSHDEIIEFMENDEKIGKTFSMLSELIDEARMDRRAIIEKARWWIDQFAVFKYGVDDYTAIDTSEILQLNIESAGRLGWYYEVKQNR